MANHQHWCWQTGWLIEVKSCAVLSGPFYCKHVKLQLACTFSRDCSVTPRFISDRAEEVRMARWPPPTVTVYWGSKLFPKHLWKLTWVWNAQMYSKVVTISSCHPNYQWRPIFCTISGELCVRAYQLRWNVHYEKSKLLDLFSPPKPCFFYKRNFYKLSNFTVCLWHEPFEINVKFLVLISVLIYSL